jgi:hypothetical protein
MSGHIGYGRRVGRFAFEEPSESEAGASAQAS